MRFEDHSLPPEKRQNKQEIKIELSPEKQIEDVLYAVDKIELENGLKNDEQQIELLKKNKALVKIKIGNILVKINEYMRKISDQEKLVLEKSNYSDEEYNEKIGELWKTRREKHNALISELHSTIRFIANNFANIDTRAIEKWEENQEERGLAVLRTKRINLPKNILCPDKINLYDRDHIAAWAADIYHSTGTLRKEPLSKK